jgi:hypothetical protein
MQGNPRSLFTTIAGNITGNRRIQQIYGQTADFEDGAVLECPNIQITNQLTFMDWVAQLSWTTAGNYMARVQIVRGRALGGPPDTPPRGGEVLSYFSTTIIPRPAALQ